MHYYFTEYTHVRMTPKPEDENGPAGFVRTVIIERMPFKDGSLPPGMPRFFARCSHMEPYMGQMVQTNFEVTMPDADTVLKAFAEYDRRRPEVEQEVVKDMKKEITKQKLMNPGPPPGSPGFPGMPGGMNGPIGGMPGGRRR